MLRDVNTTCSENLMSFEFRESKQHLNYIGTTVDNRCLVIIRVHGKPCSHQILLRLKEKYQGKLII